jgi:hypothetical protein
MSKHEEITKAVAAHAYWKVRLAQGIATRQVDVKHQDAMRDDTCEFGKWLHGAGAAAYRSDAHYKRALELHAKFHKHVGACVHEVELGHTDAAKKLLEGEVQKASTELTREMMVWAKETH